MRPGLKTGVWSAGIPLVIAGLGGSAATGSVVLAWLSLLFGGLLFAWGVTIDGQHWWAREKIGMSWPYALLLISIGGMLAGAWGIYRQQSSTSVATLATGAGNAGAAPVSRSAPVPLETHAPLPVATSLPTGTVSKPAPPRPSIVHEPNLAPLPGETSPPGKASISGDRTRYVKRLNEMYVDVGQQLARLFAAQTHEQIMTAAADFTASDKTNYAWLREQMSLSAATRFVAPPQLPMAYDWPGDHTGEDRNIRDNLIDLLKARQVALQALMETSAFDP